MKRKPHILLRTAAALAGCAAALAGILLLPRYVTPGVTAASDSSQTASAALSDGITLWSYRQMQEALSELTVVEPPEELSLTLAEETAEEVPEEPEGYRIADDALCGEVPNPDCYGSSTDPAEVYAVMAQAEELLDGQQFIWNEDLPFKDGTDFQWYLDESIFVLNWTERISGVNYWFCEVKIADASQFRRMLAGNTYGASQQLTCMTMAAEANAVLASNADFYGYRKSGINVYQGTLYRCVGGLDTCFINRRGDLLTVHRNTLNTEEEVQEFIDRNDVNFSLSFGPILVEYGEKADIGYYPVGELYDTHIRSAIGQLGDLHYLIVVSSETYIYNMTARMLEAGCITAYGLDGGQTAETVFNGQKFSHVLFDSERYVSDIIYFATAVPSAEEETP